VHLTPTGPNLSRGERLTVVLLLAVLVGLGGLFVYRSAFADRRMGDLNIYLRAAWAVRTGAADPYAVTDENGWHYAYPPLFAILLTPLADAPPGADRSGLLPYPLSVTIFYLLNVLLLAVSVHWLASALERGSAHEAVRRQRWGCRRWWLLRAGPIAACLPPLAMTLMRGQANLFVLLMLCGLAACLMRGRSVAAGLCAATAACLKVFPAYLVLVPLWRRDWRCLTGFAAGLFVGLVLLPVATMGLGRTLDAYRSLEAHVLAPGMGRGGDATMAHELTRITSTDSQSFLASIHNALYLDPATRPPEADPWVRRLHWLLAGLFTLLTLAATLGRRGRDASGTALFVGALAAIMVLTSPLGHLHYFVLAIPLVMGLLARGWEREPDGAAPAGWFGLRRGPAALLGLFLVGQTLPQLAPAMQVPRDVGAAMYVTLALWLGGCLALRRPAPTASPSAPAAPAARAA
jgi:hypothetical protein